MRNLTNKILTGISHAPVAAGATNVTDCNVVDMQGYEGVRFIVGFGTITAGAVTGIKAQQAAAKTSATALTSGADLAGTLVSVLDTDDNKLCILDIYRPAKRYVQLVITRATQNAVVDYAFHEQYSARKLPVTKDANVAAQELWASPAEGTA